MMTRIVTVLGLALALAGCGADGEPVRPEPKQATGSGVRVSGSARVGISVSRSGVDPLAMQDDRVCPRNVIAILQDTQPKACDRPGGRECARLAGGRAHAGPQATRRDPVSSQTRLPCLALGSDGQVAVPDPYGF